MSDGLWDFDAGWQEADEEPYRVRFLGKEWSLPASCPADVILRLERNMIRLAQLQRDGVDEVPDDFEIDDTLSAEGVCRALVGKDIVDQWLATPGCTYQRMLDMSRRLLQLYRGGDPTEVEALGKATPPNRADRRATKKKASPRKSGTGGRSKPTGTGTTG